MQRSDNVGSVVYPVSIERERERITVVLNRTTSITCDYLILYDIVLDNIQSNLQESG